MTQNQEKMNRILKGILTVLILFLVVLLLYWGLLTVYYHDKNICESNGYEVRSFGTCAKVFEDNTFEEYEFDEMDGEYYFKRK